MQADDRKPDGSVSYDLIVIGSGQGGTALARTVAERGERVLLVERNRLGGTCVNVGCTPAKAMAAAAFAVGQARRVTELGIETQVTVDFPRVMARIRKVRDLWRDGVGKIETVDGLDVVYAEARFGGPDRVLADGRAFQAERIVIDTGTSPRMPDIPGLKDAATLTNESVFDLENLPARTAVLGGGFIGLELGQALSRFGSRVTVVNRGDRLFGREAEWAGDMLAQAFADEGIDIRYRCELASVAPRDDGTSELTFDDGATLTVDAVLVAAGRVPNTGALDLDRAGIRTDKRGYIVVDEHLLTGVPGVWAIGDVAGRPAFTHVSWEDHLRLLAAWDGSPRTAGDRVLAYSLFTDPQIGRVGMSSQQLDAEGRTADGRPTRVSTKDLSKTARGVEWGHRRGYAEMVVDRGDGTVLGATIVGHEASELVQVVLPLVEAGLGIESLAAPVAVHPTYVEALRTLARTFGEAETDS